MKTFALLFAFFALSSAHAAVDVFTIEFTLKSEHPNQIHFINGTNSRQWPYDSWLRIKAQAKMQILADSTVRLNFVDPVVVKTKKDDRDKEIVESEYKYFELRLPLHDLASLKEIQKIRSDLFFLKEGKESSPFGTVDKILAYAQPRISLEPIADASGSTTRGQVPELFAFEGNITLNGQIAYADFIKDGAIPAEVGVVVLKKVDGFSGSTGIYQPATLFADVAFKFREISSMRIVSGYEHRIHEFLKIQRKYEDIRWKKAARILEAYTPNLVEDNVVRPDFGSKCDAQLETKSLWSRIRDYLKR